jgi:hypothetical protein
MPLASGLCMYKLKEEIWSSHKILAEQVRASATRPAPQGCHRGVTGVSQGCHRGVIGVS